MLQNPCKALSFKKNMVYKIPPGGEGKPYPASGLFSRVFFPQIWPHSAGLGAPQESCKPETTPGGAF